MTTLHFERFEDASHWSYDGGKFVCLVVADSTAQTADVLIEFGRSLLVQGAVYVCSWGPGCKALHDAVDQAFWKHEGEAAQELPVVMTTWHDDEPLDEALWFALNSALPDEGYLGAHKNIVVLSVGERTWKQQLETAIQLHQ